MRIFLLAPKIIPQRLRQVSRYCWMSRDFTRILSWNGNTKMCWSKTGTFFLGPGKCSGATCQIISGEFSHPLILLKIAWTYFSDSVTFGFDEMKCCGRNKFHVIKNRSSHRYRKYIDKIFLPPPPKKKQHKQKKQIQVHKLHKSTCFFFCLFTGMFWFRNPTSGYPHFKKKVPPKTISLRFLEVVATCFCQPNMGNPKRMKSRGG